MNKMIYFLIVLMLASPLKAQWVKTNISMGSNTNCLSLAANDTYVFAGSSKWGVWRSSNNGQVWDWISMNTNVGEENINHLCIHNSYLFASGYLSLPLTFQTFRSGDNGKTWQTLTLPTVTSLASVGSFLFAGTTAEPSLQRSTDNGANWTSVRLTANSSNSTNDVIAIASSNSTLFVSTGDKVFQSHDLGVSWIGNDVNNLATVIVEKVNCLLVNNNIVYAGCNFGKILKSTDDGTSWLTIGNGLPQVGIQSLTISGTKIIAGTSRGIYLSVDEGSNFVNISAGMPTNSEVIECVVISGDHVFAGLSDGIWVRPLSEFVLYTINTASIPSDGGLTSGGGFYILDQTVTLNASANYGYTFLNWTENGNLISLNSTFNIIVNRERNLIANYVKQFKIATNSNLTTGGSTKGGGLYNPGDVVTVSATANIGYGFLNWTENGNVISINSTYSFQANGDKILMANFVKQFKVVTQSNSNALGTTSGGGYYNPDVSVSVIANPNTGYGLVNWTENGIEMSTNINYQFSIKDNRNLVANFKKLYMLTTSCNPINSGIITGANTYFSGQTVTLTATPNTGYTFTNWTENGTAVSTSSNYTFTISANRTLVANFTINSYSLTITSTNGTVVKNPDQTNYNNGTIVTLTATPSTGYTFTGWTGDVTDSTNPLTITINTNKNITANFTINRYTVTLTANPGNGGIVSGSGTYDHGSSVTVIATAKNISGSRFQFTNWTENGNEVSKSASYIFTTTASRNLIAKFLDITSVEKEESILTKYTLSQNYPNPFNPSTKIQFGLPKEVSTRLTVCNSLGQELFVLVNQELGAGTYSVNFDASQLSNGIYFYKLEAGDFYQTKKMILLK